MTDASWLIQILLPVYDNSGQPFGEGPFAETRAELTGKFGGLTAYLRAPARGLWKTEDGAVTRDDIVIFEVMSADLVRTWWASYRGTLAARFRQEALVVRALRVETL